MNRRLGSRRGHATIALAACAALVLGGCSGDTDPDAESEETASDVGDCQEAEPAGTFQFDDARGDEVVMKPVPTTVVAQSSVAAALWDAGYKVDGVFGELGDDPSSTYQRGNVDLSEVTTIGSTWGEFDVDALAQMQPDLILDYVFDGALWYVPSKQEKTISEQAQILGVNGQPQDVDEAIGTFMDLATKLGVDTSCVDGLAEAEEDYDEALTELGEASKGLTVLVASAAETTFYVVNPAKLPETLTLEQAGLDILESDPSGEQVFKEFSWEEIGKFADADVILFDARLPEAMTDKMETIDTWTNLPAVKAGQVYPWYAGAPYSYAAYADLLDELADQLEDSEKLS